MSLFYKYNKSIIIFIYLCTSCKQTQVHEYMNHVFCFYDIQKSIKQVARRLQLAFYRSFLPQRRAFCSHHEILPRRPQTSISVFPRELPPGVRGQSAASCQPRNVTSPQTHTRKHRYTSLLHTQPRSCLLAPEHSKIYFASPSPAKEVHAREMNKREERV